MSKCGIMFRTAADYRDHLPCYDCEPRPDLGGAPRRYAVYDPVGVEESNPKDAAASTRLDLSLFPASARAYGALAFTEGDLKYGGYNWRVAGVKPSVYVAAAGRHLDKYWNGEDVDPVTGVPHLAYAEACIAVVIDAIESDKLVDDRPPKQSAALYKRFEEIIKKLQSLIPRRTVRYTEKEHGK